MKIIPMRNLYKFTKEIENLKLKCVSIFDLLNICFNIFLSRNKILIFTAKEMDKLKEKKTLTFIRRRY